LSIRS